MKVPFAGFALRDLQQYCSEREIAVVHAATLMRAVYKESDFEPWKKPLLPLKLVKSLPEDFDFVTSTIAKARVSRYDQSVKFLVQLSDSHVIEMVLMPETKRLTLCISTQVGCRQGCLFCHTATMGLKRNLLAHEIVEQIVLANRWLAQNPGWLSEVRLPAFTRVTNMVMMGMGEPLDNVDAVIKAIEILTEPLGAHLALRRISVSTAGHKDGLVQLLAAYPKAAVALSLHEADSDKRSKIMPINKKWPVEEILRFLRDHYAVHNPRASILVQYLVIAGVNDTLAHAAAVADLLEGLPVKVNLIPLNEISGGRFVAPEARVLGAMRDLIHHRKLRVMVRYSKGQDIGAACGQLAAKAELPPT
jgi:23S rRNA (adenine2503-C2)-methyltransferase